MTSLWSVILRKMPECQWTAREIRMELGSPDHLKRFACCSVKVKILIHSNIYYKNKRFKGRNILGTVYVLTVILHTVSAQTLISLITKPTADFSFQYNFSGLSLVWDSLSTLCKLSLKLGLIYCISGVFTAVFIIQSACKS